MTRTIVKTEGRSRVWISADYGSWQGKAVAYDVVKYTLQEYLDHVLSGWDIDFLENEDDFTESMIDDYKLLKEHLAAFAKAPVGVAYRVESDKDFSESDEFFATFREARDCALWQTC